MEWILEARSLFSITRDRRRGHVVQPSSLKTQHTLRQLENIWTVGATGCNIHDINTSFFIIFVRYPFFLPSFLPFFLCSFFVLSFRCISTRRMEDYRRKEKSEPELPAPADNEIRCSTNGKINRYVEVAIQMLKEQGKQSVVVVGKGATVQKAVTVVEIVKRRLEGTLHQYTQLGSVSTNEHWDPVKGKELDRITVEKKQPVIIIHLSFAAIPDLEGTSGYQAPTGNDIYTS